VPIYAPEDFRGDEARLGLPFSIGLDEGYDAREVALVLEAVSAGRFLWRATADVAYLEPAILTDAPPLRCAFTTRHAGTSNRALNLSLDRGQRAEALANRQHVLQALGLVRTTLYLVRQVHGNHVCVVDATVVQHGLQGVEGDALVTALPGVPLGVLVADCLPIMLYTSQPPVVALVHAGRMGTYHQVVRQTLKAMQWRFAVMPQQVHAVMGPAIGVCCYTLDIHAVGPFQERFADWQQYFIPRDPGLWTMDLIAANTAQLHAAGVPPEHIQAAHICTVCYNQDFYSHRAEGREAGRGMVVVALCPTSATA
jgi:polyphenol oxidase